jgi:hypothetical protein
VRSQPEGEQWQYGKGLKKLQVAAYVEMELDKNGLRE